MAREAVEICSVLDVQCGDWPESQTICEPEGDDMHLRKQTTSFKVRLEIMEQASAGLNDKQIATALDCSLWTVRKWRRRSLKLGRIGLASQMGRPATGPVSTFPKE